MTGRIIQENRSIVPACDVYKFEQLHKIVEATRCVDGVSAYKVGFDLVDPRDYTGLDRAVETIKNLYPEAVVIFDHQKVGTADVPETGKQFATKMKESGVDAVIPFPHHALATQDAWIQELLEKEIDFIFGAEMARNFYPASCLNSIRHKVTHFLVPRDGFRQIILCDHYMKIEDIGEDPVFFAPGFVDQGGNISEAAKVAGLNWHAICGRAVYNPNKKENLDDVTIEEIEDNTRQLAMLI